jgi:L-lactate dehydrogenase complex protein LldG
MSARDNVLSKVRASLGSVTGEPLRREAVTERLARAPKGVIPARGQLDDAARVALFCGMAEKIAATVTRVNSPQEVPQAVTQYLRSKNLPASVRMGEDRRLSAMPWREQRSLTVRGGPSDGDDEVGVSHALAGVAESATVVLASGKDNPSTINFLPEHHIVVLEAGDVAGDLETALARVREHYGKGQMPRTLNLISGPSRSGDIEQKIILGAHGPRALHLIVVDR